MADEKKLLDGFNAWFDATFPHPENLFGISISTSEYPDSPQRRTGTTIPMPPGGVGLLTVNVNFKELIKTTEYQWWDAEVSTDSPSTLEEVAPLLVKIDAEGNGDYVDYINTPSAIYYMAEAVQEVSGATPPQYQPALEELLEEYQDYLSKVTAEDIQTSQVKFNEDGPFKELNGTLPRGIVYTLLAASTAGGEGITLDDGTHIGQEALDWLKTADGQKYLADLPASYPEDTALKELPGGIIVNAETTQILQPSAVDEIEKLRGEGGTMLGAVNADDIEKTFWTGPEYQQIPVGYELKGGKYVSLEGVPWTIEGIEAEIVRLEEDLRNLRFPNDGIYDPSAFDGKGGVYQDKGDERIWYTQGTDGLWRVSVAPDGTKPTIPPGTTITEEGVYIIDGEEKVWDEQSGKLIPLEQVSIPDYPEEEPPEGYYWYYDHTAKDWLPMYGAKDKPVEAEPYPVDDPPPGYHWELNPDTGEYFPALGEPDVYEGPTSADTEGMTMRVVRGEEIWTDTAGNEFTWNEGQQRMVALTEEEQEAITLYEQAQLDLAAATTDKQIALAQAELAEASRQFDETQIFEKQQSDIQVAQEAARLGQEQAQFEGTLGYSYDELEQADAHFQATIKEEQRQFDLDYGISPYEREQLDASAAAQEEEIRQFDILQEQENRRYLASLKASPSNWLEYSMAKGEPAVVQPWMLPLQPGSYPHLTEAERWKVGQPIPGFPIQPVPQQAVAQQGMPPQGMPPQVTAQPTVAQQGTVLSPLVQQQNGLTTGTSVQQQSQATQSPLDAQHLWGAAGTPLEGQRLSPEGLSWEQVQAQMQSQIDERARLRDEYYSRNPNLEPDALVAWLTSYGFHTREMPVGMYIDSVEYWDSWNEDGKLRRNAIIAQAEADGKSPEEIRAIVGAANTLWNNQRVAAVEEEYIEWQKGLTAPGVYTDPYGKNIRVGGATLAEQSDLAAQLQQAQAWTEQDWNYPPMLPGMPQPSQPPASTSAASPVEKIDPTTPSPVVIEVEMPTEVD